MADAEHGGGVKRHRVAALLAAERPLPEVRLLGWVRTRRDAKECSFIEVNDGSCLANLQVVVPITHACHFGVDMDLKLRNLMLEKMILFHQRLTKE